MAIRFKDTIELINRTANVRLSDSPEFEGDRWAIYHGGLNVGPSKIPLWILNLPAGFSRNDELAKAMKRLSGAVTGKAIGQIVFADSLLEEGRFPRLASGLDQNDFPVISESAFLESFATEQLASYSAHIRGFDLTDFINPSFERKNAHREWHQVRSSEIFDSVGTAKLGAGVNVLLAEPGQGKTHFSKYLASTALAANRMPLLVSSFQWENVSAPILDSPWTTMLHVFRHYNAPIAWADGAEEKFIQLALGTGLFRLIFDGLDEYVLRSSAAISVRDTLSKFFALAETTDSQVLVTARTEFWEAEVADAFAELTAANTSIRVHIYRQQPFGADDAHRYFVKRHQLDRSSLEGGPPSEAVLAEARPPSQRRETSATPVVQADRLFALLHEAARAREESNGNTVDLVGRGFFLYNIWALVQEHGGATNDRALQLPDGQDALQWIVRSLCDRENQRLHLDMSGVNQMRMFEELAEALADVRTLADTDHLYLIAQASLNVSFDHAKLLLGEDAGRTGRLSRHPLVRQRTDKRWEFVQTQVLYFFLANRVIQVEQAGDQKALGRLLSKLNNHKYLIFELASALMARLLARGFGIAACQSICRRLVAAERGELRGTESARSAIGGCVAVLAAKHFQPGSTDKAERTKVLVSFVGDSGGVSSLWFVDSLVGFDFRNTVFKDCLFDNVQFLNCVFDGTTKFLACRFSGTYVKGSKGLESVYMDVHCTLDPILRQFLNTKIDRRSPYEYNDEDLKLEVVGVLERLCPAAAGPGSTIQPKALDDIKISKPPFGEQLASLVEILLLERAGSGDTVQYRLTKEATAAINYRRSNGVFTPPLTKVLDALIDQRNAAQKAALKPRGSA